MHNMATSPKCLCIPPDIRDEIVDIFGGEKPGHSFQLRVEFIGATTCI
jgi:hypothetical protein